MKTSRFSLSDGSAISQSIRTASPGRALWSGNSQGGFTLIELMTVIVIIGLLVTVVFAMLQESRARGRDTQRIQSLKELQKAVELYFAEVGYYPPLSGATDAVSRSTGATCTDGTTGDTEWCDLIAALTPYYKGGLDDPLSTGSYSYYYDADGAQPQSYGLMVVFETNTNDTLVNGDGGAYCRQTYTGTCLFKGNDIRGYELGPAPSQCQNSGQSWRTDTC